MGWAVRELGRISFLVFQNMGNFIGRERMDVYGLFCLFVCTYMYRDSIIVSISHSRFDE